MNKAIILLLSILYCHSLSAKSPVKVSGSLPAAGTAQVAKEICLDINSNSLTFCDYKNYILLTNPYTYQQYVYWKKYKKLSTLLPDSNLVRSVYLTHFKDTAGYKLYQVFSGKGQFKPRVMWTCSFDDSTALGYMIAYRVTMKIKGKDTTLDYVQIPAVLELTANRDPKIAYVNKELPIADHYLGLEIYSYNKDLYIKLTPDDEYLLAKHQEFKTVARFKKKNDTYKVDRIEPESMQDYLVTNGVFTNYNAYFQDNGYVLMSLSNYVLNLNTHEKIMLPIEDSIFRNLRMKRDHSIDYWVTDFKFNSAEKKFYLIYNLYNDIYLASFKPGDKGFEKNLMLFPVNSSSRRTIKDARLSWDGKKIIYETKQSSCLKTASVEEMQLLEKNYVPPPVEEE